MIDLNEGYMVSGGYQIGRRDGGDMQGALVRYGDDRIVGIIHDWDKGRRPDQATAKYALGLVKGNRMAMLKIPPLDRTMHVVCWSLEQNPDNLQHYSGGWVPLEVNAETLGLSTRPSLQDIMSIDPHQFEILINAHDDIMAEAISQQWLCSLDILNRDLETARRNLSI